MDDAHEGRDLTPGIAAALEVGTSAKPAWSGLTVESPAG